MISRALRTIRPLAQDADRPLRRRHSASEPQRTNGRRTPLTSRALSLHSGIAGLRPPPSLSFPSLCRWVRFTDADARAPIHAALPSLDPTMTGGWAQNDAGWNILRSPGTAMRPGIDLRAAGVAREERMTTERHLSWAVSAVVVLCVFQLPMVVSALDASSHSAAAGRVRHTTTRSTEAGPIARRTGASPAHDLLSARFVCVQLPSLDRFLDRDSSRSVDHGCASVGVRPDRHAHRRVAVRTLTQLAAPAECKGAGRKADSEVGAQ